MILYILFANALIAAVTLIAYSFIVLMNLIGVSSPSKGLDHGIGDESSLHANLTRFYSGELFPDLMKRWAHRLWYFIGSAAILFGLVVLFVD